MHIQEAERTLAESILRNGSANPELYEKLAQSLLAEHAVHRPRSLDGLILVQEQCNSGTLKATAIAVTVDKQSVDPMAFCLAVGSSGVLNEGSSVCFGQHSVTAPTYGSSQHNKLVNKMLASLSPELGWSVVLKRSQTGWFRDDAS